MEKYMGNLNSLPYMVKKTYDLAWWLNAKCSNSRRPFDPGTKNAINQVTVLGGGRLRFVKLRYYDGPGDEKRQTVEIERWW